jgi:hypothetical protein
MTLEWITDFDEPGGWSLQDDNGTEVAFVSQNTGEFLAYIYFIGGRSVPLVKQFSKLEEAKSAVENCKEIYL